MLPVSTMGNPLELHSSSRALSLYARRRGIGFRMGIGIKVPGWLLRCGGSGEWWESFLNYSPELLLVAGKEMYTDAGKTTPAGDTDAVYVWGDLSGNGRDYIQSTLANRPVYGAATKGLDFNGTTTLMTSTWSATTNAFTVFFVLDPDSAAAGWIIGGAGTGIIGHSGSSFAAHDGTALRQPIVGTTNAQLVAATFTGGTMTAWRDGKKLGTASYDDTWSWSNPALGSVSASYYNGLIKFVMIVPSALSDGNVQAVSAAIMSAFGLSFDWRTSIVEAFAEYAAADYADYTSIPSLGDNTGSGKRLTAPDTTRTATYSASAVGSGHAIVHDGTDWLAATTASHWKNLHAAGDMTAVVRFQADGSSGTTHVIWMTNTTFGSGVGAFLGWDAVNQRIHFYVRNGSGNVIAYSSTPGTVTRGAAHTVSVRINATAKTIKVRVDGSTIYDTTYAGTPDAGDPAQPLWIGAASSGSFPLTGAWSFMRFWNYHLTDYEVAIAEAAVAGIASARTRHVVFIMGDSITLSAQGRLQLYRRYLDSGTHRLKMVGGASGSDWQNPTDKHAGYSGDRVDEWQAAQAARFAGVATTPTHIVSQLGMNDCVDDDWGTGDYTGSDERLQTLMSDASAQWPTASLVVGECTPSTSAAVDTRIQAFNAELPTVVSNLGATLCTSSLNADVTDISGDNIHPTAAGYLKLGNDWADSLGIP